MRWNLPNIPHKGWKLIDVEDIGTPLKVRWLDFDKKELKVVSNDGRRINTVFDMKFSDFPEQTIFENKYGKYVNKIYIQKNTNQNLVIESGTEFLATKNYLDFGKGPKAPIGKELFVRSVNIARKEVNATTGIKIGYGLSIPFSDFPENTIFKDDNKTYTPKIQNLIKELKSLKIK